MRRIPGTVVHDGTHRFPQTFVGGVVGKEDATVTAVNDNSKDTKDYENALLPQRTVAG